MSSYKLLVAGKGVVLDGEVKELTVKGRSPAKALTQMAEMVGLELASQDGRYGRLTDGRTVMAATEAWGRRSYRDARTTRPMRGER